jgi:hypothetical protein
MIRKQGLDPVESDYKEIYNKMILTSIKILSNVLPNIISKYSIEFCYDCNKFGIFENNKCNECKYLSINYNGQSCYICEKYAQFIELRCSIRRVLALPLCYYCSHNSDNDNHPICGRCIRKNANCLVFNTTMIFCYCNDCYSIGQIINKDTNIIIKIGLKLRNYNDRLMTTALSFIYNETIKWCNKNKENITLESLDIIT